VNYSFKNVQARSKSKSTWNTFQSRASMVKGILFNIFMKFDAC